MVRFLGLFLACIVLAVAAYWSATRPDPAVWTHEAYVWQSPEREEVRVAMQSAAGVLDGFAILAMEVTWKSPELRLREVRLDSIPPGMKNSLVLRLGQSTATIDWTPERVQQVATWMAKLAARQPKEIQLDYDCPARRLDGYRTLLAVWQKAAGKVPLVFTALPNWLDQPTFAPLARQQPGYVLQVHALDLPTQPDQPVVLCDPATARKAVEMAGRVGVSFRVALPTYGSEVLFGSDGKVLDVVSEDSSPIPPNQVARRETVMADAPAIAALLAGWKSHRPRHLTGIVWYRLPVEGDRRNWPWLTLAAVIQARPLDSSLRLDCRASGGPARDLVLSNPGNAPATLPRFLPLPPGTMDADSARPYLLEESNNRLILIPEAVSWPWLAPGQSMVVGWFRHPNPPENIPLSFPQ